MENYGSITALADIVRETIFGDDAEQDIIKFADDCGLMSEIDVTDETESMWLSENVTEHKEDAQTLVDANDCGLMSGIEALDVDDEIESVSGSEYVTGPEKNTFGQNDTSQQGLADGPKSETEPDIERPEKMILDFVRGLPHITMDTEVASREYGQPYLPDHESVATVEGFWSKDNRKSNYLSHLSGNVFVRSFIDGAIDAKTCVGMLRSMATEYGCRAVFNLARLCERALIPDGDLWINSFSVDREAVIASMQMEDGGCVRRPNSLHPLTAADSKILERLREPATECVTLDWGEAFPLVSRDGSRKVAALTNLICALIVPAYTTRDVLSLDGQAETAVLVEHCQGIAKEGWTRGKDAIDEMCVAVCINSLVQFFSDSSVRLYNAPLRLSPFDHHPVINLSGCKYFYPDEPEGKIVATLSAPSQSSISLKQRMQRKEGKLLCTSALGVIARVVPPIIKNLPNSNRSTLYRGRRRDPFIHMDKKERPLFMRSILAISGSYGRFGLMVGYTPSSNALFCESSVDGLFASHWIRRYKKGALGETPLRNRSIDLRFYGFELVDAPGYTSCFRIRPESLHGNETDKKAQAGYHKRVVKGTSNPFYTQQGYPYWYEAHSLQDIFGVVSLCQHVQVFDGKIDRFYGLLTGDNRWIYNMRDKINVLQNCLCRLEERESRLCETITGGPISQLQSTNDKGKVAGRGKIYRRRIDWTASPQSLTQRRQICNEAEWAIKEETARILNGETCDGTSESRNISLVGDLKRTENGVALYKLMLDSCCTESTRFYEGEVRLAVQELYKYMYHVSARLYVTSRLMRGTKLYSTWQRPYDKRAFRAIEEVPRCRIPHIVTRIEESESNVTSSGVMNVMPGMEILKTRDINPRPTRHVLLSLVYGERVAEDISAVNCLEWIDWCTRSFGPSTLEEVTQSLPRHEGFSLNSRDTIKAILGDATLLLHKLSFPEAGAKGIATDKRPSKKISNDKYNTGRLGRREICTIAWTSLPNELSIPAIAAGKAMGIYPIKR
uniref:Wsv226-like protein n=1 Tax=Trachysalambria curvirostris nimavirus TaxID=2984282 RepID=A0A9C7C6W6_9VIRU|nr:MAG: wsv226-like protein [Trachysalambria curvirostris nimavirus]